MSRTPKLFAPLPSFVGVRNTVRGKLVRVVLITTLTSLCVAGIAMLTVDLSRYQKSWASDMSSEASILSVAIAPALAFNDHEAAVRNLSALAARPRVMAAALYSPDGTVYASFLRDGATPIPDSPPREGITTFGQRVEYAHVIERNGEVLGTLYMRSRYDIAGRVAAYLSIFALVTLLAVAVAFLLSRRLQRGITEPLDAMAALARAIVTRRDYSLRVERTSDDEIGVVVDAFNRMLEEVDSRSRALEASNEALEESNRALREEVAVREATQAAQREAEKALRLADRRKDEFLATLAHELRNPLAPVRHAVKVLDSETLTAAQDRWARDVIGRQVRRMALLLDDLLDVSRITQGRLDLKIETVSLSSIIEAAVETARPLIDTKRHRLTIDTPREPLNLKVDSLRLSQSLSNLLTNSAKYMDEGGQIFLTVALSTENVILTVKDTGIGLETEALAGLFEMFSQVRSAISRSEGGLGIGLALVKGLVELHGGTIDVRSAGAGLGSEFQILLPRSVVVIPDVETPAATPSPPVQAPGRRVLLADDNRDAADSLAMLLEMNGYSVTVGYYGEEALKLARQSPPSVMILDIGMPDITGFEVARRVRNEPWGQDVYMIAVTGWGQKEDKSRAIASGFDHHLTKPVDPDEVESVLQSFFERLHDRDTPAS
jgi:signal transduction histidine kinase/ActR/RegA family two-component response regulator